MQGIAAETEAAAQADAGEVAELSVSAGGAAYPNKGEDFVSLCRSADAALYEVKQNGKGAFRVKG